ncbi:MAG: flagellar biosynthetic protein FliQ [Gemmataceae bacterium]|nr:flagellar biosynthetic protein FliQ [Gemmataceae bacterium]
MSVLDVLEIGRELLWTTLLIALPSLLASLLVGLIVSILQTITSIQEQTLSFVPRLIAVGFVLLFTMSWALQQAVNFTVRMLGTASEVVR